MARFDLISDDGHHQENVTEFKYNRSSLPFFRVLGEMKNDLNFIVLFVVLCFSRAAFSNQNFLHCVKFNPLGLKETRSFDKAQYKI